MQTFNQIDATLDGRSDILLDLNEEQILITVKPLLSFKDVTIVYRHMTQFLGLWENGNNVLFLNR